MPNVAELTDARTRTSCSAPARDRGSARSASRSPTVTRAATPAGTRTLARRSVAPISYSVAREQLHHALAGYKRLGGDVARRFSDRARRRAVALPRPPRAVRRARRRGSPAFELVTTVPSSDRGRDARHPLHRIVGELVAPTRGRYERLLTRSVRGRGAHGSARTSTSPLRRVAGESVLVIDDTWTTGANAQSAAATLKQAGAGLVAAVMIGRHINRELAGQRSATARPAAAVRAGRPAPGTRANRACAPGCARPVKRTERPAEVPHNRRLFP